MKLDKDGIIKYFMYTLVVAIAIGGIAMAWPEYLRGRELRRKDAELAAKIEEKRAEIARLAENQRRFRSDPDFVEQIARQNRRVFPGELVFVFPEKDGKR